MPSNNRFNPLHFQPESDLINDLELDLWIESAAERWLSTSSDKDYNSEQIEIDDDLSVAKHPAQGSMNTVSATLQRPVVPVPSASQGMNTAVSFDHHMYGYPNCFIYGRHSLSSSSIFHLILYNTVSNYTAAAFCTESIDQ